MATGTALVAAVGWLVLSCPAGDADALATTIRRGLDDPRYAPRSAPRAANV